MSTTGPSMIVRRCHNGDFDALLRIINSAASAYRGVIPDDCWHEPYMAEPHLRDETAGGVSFVGADIAGTLAGVMGIQRVRNVELIRHAYVLPEYQRHGIGAVLMSHLKSQSLRQILVGTWSAATWAIRFYERHEFHLVPGSRKAALLASYWSIPDRQVEASVVLALPALSAAEADRLMQGAGQPVRPQDPV